MTAIILVLGRCALIWYSPTFTSKGLCYSIGWSIILKAHMQPISRCSSLIFQSHFLTEQTIVAWRIFAVTMSHFTLGHVEMN